LQRQLLEKAAEDLLRLTKRYDSARPGASRAAAHARTGDLLKLLGRPREARQQYERAQQVADDVLADEPGNARAQYCWCQAVLGLAELGMLERKHVECKKLLSNLIGRAEAMLRRDPGDRKARLALATGCSALGSAHLECGEKAEARRWALRSLEVTPAELKDRPSTAPIWFTLGMLDRDAQDWPAARRHLEKAQALYARMPGTRASAASALAYLAEVCGPGAGNDRAAATGYACAAARLAKDNVAADPGNVVLVLLSAAVFYRCAEVAQRLGSTAQALAWCQEGLHVLDRLDRAGQAQGHLKAGALKARTMLLALEAQCKRAKVGKP
jgi:tetratricopeptide (TPR) repeat protein